MAGTDNYPILFDRRWSARGLEGAIASVDSDTLCAEYVALRESAPRRAQSGKSYFVGHTGIASGAGASNRLEEHFAIALVNLGRRWPRPDGGWFRLLDYQVPLKARQADTGIGKIDLLGVTEAGRLVVAELKVEGEGGGRSDAPPAALMEGLRYAAMIEADLDAVAAEAERRFGVKVVRLPPIVQLLAPKAWWRRWLELPAAGDWGPPFTELAAAIAAKIGAPIECMGLDDAEITYGVDEPAPRLDPIPNIHAVYLTGTSPIGNSLPQPSPDSGAESRYLGRVSRTLWTWADRYHVGQLDGGRRPKRPPVLDHQYTDMNVLVPPDGSHAEQIRAAIAPHQRHRHFTSLRSSQALAQSVFANIAAAGRLDLLANVTAECGRSAFSTDHEGWTLEFEHDVDLLGEPRPTSIDVLLARNDRRVAVECKFTEAEFGTCSRPRLRPGDPGYPEKYCDGSYRRQESRKERCALTSIGVRYWEHLPRLFAWSADRDHDPCPFGTVYQLARNALAATVMASGEIDPATGHALVVYDAHNPVFDAGGDADRQWEAAVGACLVPGLLRRVSWQRLAGFITPASELTWLVDSLREKYGIVAD
ncbi:MAG: hypothetical protein RLO50_11105 [Azospirillaceae bacterium]